MTFFWGAKKTLSPDNQWRFDCPIFHTQERICDCLALRDQVWRGDRVEAKGCAVAMHASKCPIVHVVNLMLRHDTDPYHSADPVVGKLHSDVIDRITSILVPEKDIERSGATSEEQQKLLEANAQARAGARPIQSSSGQPKVTRKHREPTVSSATTESAASLPQQDLGALVNAMAAETRKPKTDPLPAEAPAPVVVHEVRPQASPAATPAGLKPFSLLDLARERAKETKTA